MRHEHAPWAESVATLPLAFAQVREDALGEMRLLERLPENTRILLVASGGCTAAALATSPQVEYLRLVDPNQAQLDLTRMKIHLLSAPAEDRLLILGHSRMSPEDRRAKLKKLFAELELPDDVFGPLDFVAEVGPDQSGRYERVFEQLRRAMGSHRAAMMDVLRLRDPEQQRANVAPETELGQALDVAFDDVMALPNLVHLFGSEATNNPVEPFSRHFAGRTRRVLATMPAADNPYLWQVFAGHFPADVASPWLEMQRGSRLPEMTFSRSFMIETLESHREEFDFVQLSNILDWLSPEKAARTLELAWQSLRPGGWVLIRQLNSSLDIPVLGDRFDWHTQEANAMHAADRSFFYRKMHLGQKR